jgi:hypothetical protein
VAAKSLFSKDMEWKYSFREKFADKLECQSFENFFENFFFFGEEMRRNLNNVNSLAEACPGGLY